MRSVLAYAPRPGPLGRRATVDRRRSTWRRWRSIAFTFANPLVLVAAGGGGGRSGDRLRGRPQHRASRCAGRSASR